MCTRVVARYVFDQRHALAAPPSVLAHLEEGVSLLIRRGFFGGYVTRRKEPTPRPELRLPIGKLSLCRWDCAGLRFVGSNGVYHLRLFGICTLYYKYIHR